MHLRGLHGPLVLCLAMLAASAGVHAFSCELAPPHVSAAYTLPAVPFSLLAEIATPPSTTQLHIRGSLCAVLRDKDGHEECGAETLICTRVVSVLEGVEHTTQIVQNAARDHDWQVQEGNGHLNLTLHGSEYAHVVQRTELHMVCDRAIAADSPPSLQTFDAIAGVLKLVWNTPAACPHAPGESPPPVFEPEPEKQGPEGGDAAADRDRWGFWSWLFFLGFVFGGLHLTGRFLRLRRESGNAGGSEEGGSAAGTTAAAGLRAARDLVPDGLSQSVRDFAVAARATVQRQGGELWREGPYLIREFGRHLVRTVSGHSRAGYEPV